MRSTLTLSLPADMLKVLKQKAKRRGLSVSYYVRMILTHEERIISEEQLLAYCKEAEEDYRKGRTVTLKNPKDLENDL